MNNEIIFYSTPDGDKKVEVLFQDENFWLTQKALAGLFDVKVPAVSKHLKSIFESGELEAVSVIIILETTAADGKSYKTRYYNPDIHHRRSIRLKGYDYSQAGAYFITISAENRECLFGKIVDKEMILSDPGRLMEKLYRELENKFADIVCDQCAIMPNHIHFVIHTGVGADLRVCPDTDTGEHILGGEQALMGEHIGSPLQAVIQWFKTMTTNEYIRGVKQNGWPPFPGKLWQHNYYEHIVRDDDELNRIREYIIDNPLKWELDRENPNGQWDIGQAQRPAPTKDEPWLI
jgi:REP element-mobilizing transposase RayT